MKQPKYYIQTFYEKRDGFRYEQPIKRLKGKTYYEFAEGSFERENWGFIAKQSYYYNEAIFASQFKSKLWKSKAIKTKAFYIIYEFIRKGKSGTGSSITPLFPFEIFMLNDGFEIISFGELNAINPCVTVSCEKVIGDEIIGVKGIKKTRTYVKNNKQISLCFGLIYDKKKTNFYFEINGLNDSFQVDNSINNYEKAISGLLPSLTEKPAY